MNDTRSEILAGWKVVLPVSIGVIPLGLALGVLVVQSGLAWYWALLISLIVFAGSMEFLLVGLFAAAAPLAQIALSAFLVNFRHVFYALTFPLHRVNGIGWKAYSTFTLTDEAYGLTTSRDAQTWSRAKIIAIEAGLQIVWVISVIAGALLGGLIPPEIIGIDFAVTALFVVLAIEAYKAMKSLPIVSLALLCALVGAIISKEHMLLISMGMFVVALTASYLFAKHREVPADE